MATPTITRNRIIAAFVIAVAADAIQLPITAVTNTGILALPGECADFLVDCFVMGATTMLLGFHWILLPSLFVEVIPDLDLLPTWTGCVAFVVLQRKKEQAIAPPAPSRPPLRPVTEIKELRLVREVPATASQPSEPSLIDCAEVPTQTSPSPESSAERRLTHLRDLLAKALISQTEHDAKRQKILEEL